MANNANNNQQQQPQGVPPPPPQGQGAQQPPGPQGQVFQLTQADLTTIVANAVQQAWSSRSSSAPTFGLSPAHQTATKLIDYETKHGLSIFDACQEGLQEKFAGSPEMLSSFTDSMTFFAGKMYWNQTIGKIPTSASGDTANLFKIPTLIKSSDILAHAKTYLSAETRLAQDNTLAVSYLRASLTGQYLSTVNTDKAKFEVTYTDSNGDTKTEPSFALMYKHIVDSVSLNCQSKRRTVEQQLLNSPSIMAQCKGNPSDYTTEFNVIYESFISLGGTDKDVISNYTKGLQNSSCDEFNLEISREFTTWDKGDKHLPWGPKGAMIKVGFNDWKTHALDHYRYLVGAEKWTSVNSAAKLDAANSQIIAMQSEIKELKMKGGLKSASSPSSRRSTKSSNGRKQAASTKSKNKKDRSNQRRQRVVEEWRKTPPGPNEPHEKMVDGKKEIWCTYHSLWQRHTSEECNLGKKQRAASANAHNVTSNTYASAASASSALMSLAALSRSD